MASGAGAVGTGHLDLARATVCEPCKETAEPSGAHALVRDRQRVRRAQSTALGSLVTRSPLGRFEKPSLEHDKSTVSSPPAVNCSRTSPHEATWGSEAKVGRVPFSGWVRRQMGEQTRRDHGRKDGRVGGRRKEDG